MSSSGASRPPPASPSAEPAGWLRAAGDGVVLAVHVGPGASRPGVAGFHGEALRLRVTAPPSGGAANREVVRLLATLLGVPASAVAITGGLSARKKRVRVQGIAVATVRDRLLGAFR